ncbi:50S ribosomal protein L13 [Candidatus Clavichlamydia salmonicola]|uniref:50S ribosomal protein L13 n=1 Tax=Candidatus Clavichlamydia salmonicola TaxID=469812 RepID=UPI001891AD50|nr:50S ribosomal protein L13 [Candidatus Clavichlamydia salmonicola]
MEKRQDTKTTFLKAAEVIGKSWVILDAKGKTLGRLSSEISKILRGKHKVTYTPHIDSGDGVIVINGDQVKLTGNKEAQKMYRYYTGNIGGMREVPFRHMKARKPEYVITHAVQGMMPRTRLGRKQMKSLRVIAGDDKSAFAAQQPAEIKI